MSMKIWYFGINLFIIWLDEISQTEMTQQPLEEETAFQRLIEIEEKYHHYFEKHGIQYIKIEK